MSTPGATYRLLEPGERILPGDQWLDHWKGDGVWLPVRMVNYEKACPDSRVSIRRRVT